MFSILPILVILYTLLFIFSIRLKDNSIVDVFWSIGFMIIAVVTYFEWKMELPQSIVTFLILIWGIRLSSHIGFRKILEKKEDARYALWREQWGNWWYFYSRSFLQVYMLQMLLLIVVALPIFIVNILYTDISIPVLWFPTTHSTLYSIGMNEDTILLPIVIISILGLLIAIFWLVFESIADYQLAQFIKIKKPGEIFTSWLYRYSRHPNYFWESIFWLGISLIALPYSFFGLTWWIVITILLLFVSWVPLQEARYAGWPNWENYKKRTSVFVPWFLEK